MTLSERQAEFAHNVATLIVYIFGTGYKCTFGDAYRDPEVAKLYASQGKGIVNSLHCKRLAIDLNLFSRDGKFLSDTKDHEPFGIFWEKLHKDNKWGGRFKKTDGNHYEMSE
jgi:hypothetical protein